MHTPWKISFTFEMETDRLEAEVQPNIGDYRGVHQGDIHHL